MTATRAWLTAIGILGFWIVPGAIIWLVL